MLLLRTLGGLSIAGDDLSPSATQPRRLALLVLLARAPDQTRSRAALLALLWPDSSEERARHGLDQLLYVTRRDLGRDAILTEPGRLRLNSERVSADCVAFEEALRRGRLEEAVGLYAGPFLDGIHLADVSELEHWIDAQRADLARAFGDAVDQLARAAELRGDHTAAVSFWKRRADADPFDDTVAVSLMRALERAGDITGALQHARAHTARLQQEFEVTPDPAMSALVERLTEARTPPGPDAVTTRAALTGASSAGPAAAALHGRVEPEPEPDHTFDQETVVRRSRLRLERRPVRWSVVSLALVLILGAGLVVTMYAGRGPAVTASSPAAEWSDPAARALYLRGMVEWNHRTRAGLEAAVVLFRRAVEMEPAAAAAHAALAQAYVMLGYHGYMAPAAAFSKGRAAAETALDLDPASGDAYAALGVALQAERRWKEAEQAFERAIVHAPRSATAHQWYALLLTILGRTEEAVTHGRHAAELDPMSIQVSNTFGIMLYNAGMSDSALAVYSRIVTHEPDTAWVRQNPWVLANFGKVAAFAGRADEALPLLERSLEADPGHPRLALDLARVHLARGDAAAARHAFTRADSQHVHYAINRALLHAELGEFDQAFDWFGRVREWSLPSLTSLSGRGMGRVRQDPRYSALRARIGLPAPPLSSTQ